MAVPDYQALLLPLLKLAGDGVAETLVQAEVLLAKQFSLSTEGKAAASFEFRVDDRQNSGKHWTVA
jgi:hypothetical protein